MIKSVRLLLFASLSMLVFLVTMSLANHRAKLRLANTEQLAISRLNMPASIPSISGKHPCVVADIASDSPAPRLGSCSGSLFMQGPVDSFEADLRYGRFVMRETDLYLEDIFKIPLIRTYNSHDWHYRNRDHAFGRNANHPYDISPAGSTNPYSYMFLRLEDGESLYFDRITPGGAYDDAVYQHNETECAFYKATDAWNGNGWTIRLRDGLEIRFPDSYGATRSAQGAPIEIGDARGNRLLLVRDSNRNLMEIRTPHRHWIRFEYDNSFRIVHAFDDKGNSAAYVYSATGLLSKVALSSGSERHYEYEGDLLVRVKDQNGKVLLENSYSKGLLIRNGYDLRPLQQQRFINRTVVQYQYEWPVGRYYAESVNVTLPGKASENVNVAQSVPREVKNWH